MTTCIHQVPTWYYLCIGITKAKIISHFLWNFLQWFSKVKKNKLILAMVNQDSSCSKGRTHLRNCKIKKLVLCFYCCFIAVTSLVLYWIVQQSSGWENNHFLLSLPLYLPGMELVLSLTFFCHSITSKLKY